MPIPLPSPEPELVPGDPKVVSLKAYDRYRMDFAEHFRTTGNMNALLGQVQEVPWSELMAQWRETKRYMAIHYGVMEYIAPGLPMETAYVLRLGFSMHDVEEDSYAPPIAPDYMPDVEWDGRVFIPSVPSGSGKWPAGERYVAQLEVARTDVDQGFEALNGGDPRVCIFDLEDELVPLFTANGGTGSGEGIKLQISTIARCYNTDDGGLAGFRTGLCLCILRQLGSIWERQLDNTVHVLPLQARALDYGGLCPPNCKVQ